MTEEITSGMPDWMKQAKQKVTDATNGTSMSLGYPYRPYGGCPECGRCGTCGRPYQAYPYNPFVTY